jgi:hypothetical protein
MLPKATQEVMEERMFCFFVSKESLDEIETHLLAAKNLGYLSDRDCLPIEDKKSETTRSLNG